MNSKLVRENGAAVLTGNFDISGNDRIILRNLARKQLEYSQLPVMAERERLWYKHNALKADRPVVVFDINSFLPDLLPPLNCESETARLFEKELLRHTVNHELVDDDKVVPDYFTLDYKINIRLFNLDYHISRATPDSTGRTLAYHTQKNIEDLDRDFNKLSSSIVTYDSDYTNKMYNLACEIFGDILPIVLKNNSLIWFPGLSGKIVSLMGLQDMMLNFYDNPEKMHQLYNFITEDTINVIKQQENENLLTLNNKNDYTGAGSRGYTNELPKSTDGKIRASDLWGNMNSQETVSVSPVMYHEFCFPCYMRIAEQFGLVYYGCCEPVHDIWEDSVSKYPNLRKVSISAWCDEDFMGEALRGSGVIYSRKPSPNYIGVGRYLDEESFTAHITKTLQAARGCSLEILFRDIVTLTGDNRKPGKAMKIVRRLIDQLWRQ